MPLLGLELHHLGSLHRASVYPSSYVLDRYIELLYIQLYVDLAARWSLSQFQMRIDESPIQFSVWNCLAIEDFYPEATSRRGEGLGGSLLS